VCGGGVSGRVSKVVFLYYTGVWALVSTLMVHIQRHFHADEVRYVATQRWAVVGPMRRIFDMAKRCMMVI
jgi:hypothetical protein